MSAATARPAPMRAKAMAAIERLRGAKAFEFERPLDLRIAPSESAEREELNFLLLCPHLAVLCWLRMTFGVPGVHVPGEPVPQSPKGGIGGFSPSGKLLTINGALVTSSKWPIHGARCDENTKNRLGCVAQRTASPHGWHHFNNQVLAEIDRIAGEFARHNPSLFKKAVR